MIKTQEATSLTHCHCAVIRFFSVHKKISLNGQFQPNNRATEFPCWAVYWKSITVIKDLVR